MTSITIRPAVLYVLAAAMLLIGAVVLWSASPQPLPGPSGQPSPRTANTSAAITDVGASSTRPATRPDATTRGAVGDVVDPAPPVPASARASFVATSLAPGVDEPMDQSSPDPADAPAGGPQTVAVNPASASAVAAVEAATGFTAAYARPTTAAQQDWWAGVTPHLSPQAVLDYEGVLPSRVPYARVTGPGRLEAFGDGSQRVLLVAVPVDTGTVRVHLVPDEARGWVVTRAEMPDPR